MLLKDAIKSTENETENKNETAREFDRRMTNELWRIEGDFKGFARSMSKKCHMALIVAFVMWVLTFVATPDMVPTANIVFRIALVTAGIFFLIPIVFAVFLEKYVRPTAEKAIRKRYEDEENHS